MSERRRERILDEVRRDQILQIWIAIGCLGIGVGIFALSRATGDPSLAEATDKAIIALSLSTLLYISFRINTHQAEFARLKRLARHMQDDLAALTLWSKKSKMLQEVENDTIKRVGVQLMRDYLNMFQVDNDGFRLQDKKWSLHFNKIFWSDMIEKSASLNGGLTVLVTHTSSIEHWIGEEATSSLIQQRDFIGERNRIIRMFVQRVSESTSKIPEEYQRIMADMTNNYKIDTVYVGVASATWPPIPDATWLPELDIFMTWIGASADLFSIGGSPLDLAAFKDKWPYYFEKASSLDGVRPILSSKLREYLRRP